MELTQAPGLSAYNRAERKMFHLSKELSGDMGTISLILIRFGCFFSQLQR